MNLTRRYVFVRSELYSYAAQVIDDCGGSGLKVLFPNNRARVVDRATIDWHAQSHTAKIAFERERAQLEHDCARETATVNRRLGRVVPVPQEER